MACQFGTIPSFAFCIIVFFVTVISINNQRISDIQDNVLELNDVDVENIVNKKRVIKMKTLEDQYCVGFEFLTATESFRLSDGLEPVTLAIHATSDMLLNLEKNPAMWDGPISVGLFIDVQSQNVLEYLSDLHRCDQEFNRKMTIHFAARKFAFQKECPKFEIAKSNRSCWEFFANQASLRKNISSPFTLYPSSLLRNIARKGAKSDLHFLMDAGMIVSEGMAEKIKSIANKMINGKNKNVLLVRRFENANGTLIPKNVIQLKTSINDKKTFEFHQIENLPYWFKKSQDVLNISSWEIPYSGPLWEPQPILHRNDPYNADYFPAKIRNVQSLIYKLCRANYTFHLLSHVFDVHEGVKTGNTKYSDAVASHQFTYAWKKYLDFL